jgi:DNA-binding NarL/FixJ family response regulator
VTVTKYILLVDDNEVVRIATRHFLESQPGFVVCGEAVDGTEALEKSRELSPDLIILDLVMPRMNGLQAGRALRATMRTCQSFYLPGTPTRSNLRTSRMRELAQ